MENSSVQSVQETEITEEKQQLWLQTEKKVKYRESEAIFEPGETVPVVLNGKVCGYLSINWVQRIGLWDYNNFDACKAGVKDSYSINYHLDFSESISAAETLTVTVTPSLVTDTGKLGSACNLGWTGFPQFAQFYDNTKEIDAEVGLQPETLDTSDCNIKFDIVDNLGNVYDSVLLSEKYLSSASEGVGLETDGRTIHCVNGAEFYVGVSEVSINELYSDIGEVYKRYYDIDYDIEYNSAPTSDREDLRFDSSNNNSLRTKFAMSINSDVDSTLCYEGNDKTRRQLYADDEELRERYTTTEFKDLSVDGTSKFTVNRLIPETTGTPKYVRVGFEFPEEANARTLDEMKDFDGRFCVVQKLVTTRELPLTPEETDETEE